MNDLDLPRGEIGRVAFHVVEQDREIVDANIGEEGQFARQRLLRRTSEIAIDLERTQAGAEAHTDFTTLRRPAAKLRGGLMRMILLPALTQERISLWRVEIEAIAMRCEKPDRLFARLPRP